MNKQKAIRAFAVVWFVFSMVLMSHSTGDLARLFELVRGWFGPGAIPG